MKLSIDADAREAIAALEKLGTAAETHLLAAAKETAERIADEARGRVRRRTGQTLRGITVQPLKKGIGYAVFVEQPEIPTLDIWLEFGTQRMTPKPFLLVSARLEEGAHERRVIQAINDAIAEASR